MKTLMSGAGVVSLVCAAGLLSGCGSGSSTEEQSFGFTGSSLSVVTENPNMPVLVRTREGTPKSGSEVSVSVTTKAVGKSAEVPAWSLSNRTLQLGTPCGNGWVGYCEGSYTVTVPKGVAVSVNGKPVNAG